MKNSATSLLVNEIFYSIQGESSFAGSPCVFIRLTGCNLRCSYCDTTYAYDEGKKYFIEAVVKKVRDYQCKLVEVTGGEPLIQEGVYRLLDRLIESGYQVLIETNGSMPIARINPQCIKIVDIKCPGSGMSDKMDWKNLKKLSPRDEVKFVIGDRKDYTWSVEMISQEGLEKNLIYFSPVFGRLKPERLAKWILEDRLPVRLQLQWHKHIWPHRKRGV
jgi:7-carboxy-7-deazaguanine synthase